MEVADGILEPERIKSWLRNYVAQGILQMTNGVIFGEPQDEKYYDEYKEIIQETMKENGLGNLPVLFDLIFGYTKPKTVLPYGAMAETIVIRKRFRYWKVAWNENKRCLSQYTEKVIQ